jgi:hypothetical protein
MKDIEIFVLTHKKYEIITPNPPYIPLLMGAYSKKDYFNYIPDNSGDNISDLNKYYAELTGEYWAWKNTNARIIGFCHYRRYFAKGFSMKILSKQDILDYLNDFDIILPEKTKLRLTVCEELEKAYKTKNQGAKIEEFKIIREIIKKESPEYLKSFDSVLNGKECYNSNMFICSKKIADEYFEWVFNILDVMHGKINYESYDENNRRVLGYLSEVLLTIFIHKNNYSIKNCAVYHTGRKYPLLQSLSRKYPLIHEIEDYLIRIKNSN